LTVAVFSQPKANAVRSNAVVSPRLRNSSTLAGFAMAMLFVAGAALGLAGCHLDRWRFISSVALVTLALFLLGGLAACGGGSSGSGGGGGGGGGNSVTVNLIVQANSGQSSITLGTVSITVPAPSNP
jgi:hypothetical protein